MGALAGASVLDLGNGYGEVVEEAPPIDPQWQAIGWKWYGAYGRNQENFVLRAESFTATSDNYGSSHEIQK